MTKLFVKPIHLDAMLPVKSTTHAAAYDVCAYLDDQIIKTWSPLKSEAIKYHNNAGIPSLRVPFDEESGIAELVEFFDAYQNKHECIDLEPGERAIIPTGLKIATDINHCTTVLPRSGLSIKNGLTVINAPGLIDPDYRDELMILVVNLSNTTQTIRHGDRIAQIRVERIIPIDIVECDELPGTTSDRQGGLGSTGVGHKMGLVEQTVINLESIEPTKKDGV